MAELSTLARPYAKAAFEHAVAAGALPQWSAMLDLLAALATDSRVAGVLAAPSLTASSKGDHLIALAGDALDAGGVNFIRTLADNRRLALLPQIAEQFGRLKANLEMTVDVEVTSAHGMDPDQQQKLAQALRARLKREVRLNVTIDNSLIGGAVIRAGDTVIDGSIRGRLAKLAEALQA